jgi:ribose 5-phosphate isomerase B
MLKKKLWLSSKVNMLLKLPKNYLANMKIAIASDHAGYLLKEIIKQHLTSLNVAYVDFGTNSKESVDYPDFAKQLVNAMENNQCQVGVLICHSGIGMSIAANRSKKIRAALCYNENLVEMSRKHNDANVLVLGAGYTSNEHAILMIDKFLNTKFEAGRHLLRIEKL